MVTEFYGWRHSCRRQAAHTKLLFPLVGDKSVAAPLQRAAIIRASGLPCGFPYVPNQSFGENGKPWKRLELEDEAQFGPKVMKHDYQTGTKIPKSNFEEAPWIYKIGDTYFLEYAAGGVPEHWAYSTAKSITCPWHYEGRITGEAPGAFTIHGGTIDFKGKSYLFYHDAVLSKGNGFRRSTGYVEFKRQKDGRIPFINLPSE